MAHISNLSDFEIKADGYVCPRRGIGIIMFGGASNYVSLTDAEAQLAIAELKAAIKKSQPSPATVQTLKPTPSNTEGK